MKILLLFLLFLAFPSSWVEAEPCRFIERCFEQFIPKCRPPPCFRESPEQTGPAEEPEYPDDEPEDETEPPATKPPATQPPATKPPATQPPATKPPATQASAPRAPARRAPKPYFDFGFGFR